MQSQTAAFQRSCQDTNKTIRTARPEGTRDHRGPDHAHCKGLERADNTGPYDLVPSLAGFCVARLARAG